jgi:hypothetical protein
MKLAFAQALLASGLATLAAGCDLAPGDWFLNLSPHLQAHYVELPERAVEPGWQKLATEYQIQVVTAELHIRKIDLVGSPTNAAAFDPANPPAGYSLCHNGHCHAADGRLVAYEDIAAEAAGGAIVGATLGGGTWNLLPPSLPTPLACPSSPGCHFGEATFTRASITLDRLRLQGVVRDGPGVTAPVGTTPFLVELIDTPATPLPAIVVPLPLVADNRHAPDVTLTLTVVATAALLDGVSWAAHPAGPGGIDLSAGPQAAATRASITESLIRLAVQTNLQR